MALIYGVDLPPPGAPDVVKRELTVVVNGGDPVVHDVTDPASFELSLNDGDTAVLTLIDEDDAGNRSAPSPEFTLTASDTLAPPAPGELGVHLIREEGETGPAPEPNP